jgi:hypothetical protein
MPWYETPAFFIFWAVFFVVGRLLDIWSSQHFDWYGGKEANKLWRHKDGTFNTGLNVIFSGVYFGISCLIGLLAHSWGAAAALIIVAGPASAIMAYFNFRSKKKTRIEQTELLKTLREYPGSQMSWGLMITRAGRSFFPLFQFLSVPADPGNEGEVIVRADRAVRDYAVNVSPEQWFKY